MDHFFYPSRVFFEKEALDYEKGRELWEYFKNSKDIKLTVIGSHNRVTGIPGSSPQIAFREAKKSLVVGVRKSREFQTCKPSAHYQLPLATSCPGMCQYCYLHTTLGKKPYLRIYVNIREILNLAQKYIDTRLPESTVFEGSATSDPLAVENFSGNLKESIVFFGKSEKGFFRFVTKFTNVDSLLDIEHNNRTRFRFSINTPFVISNYEYGTPSIEERIKAASKVAKAGYPVGFIIAPIIIYPNWQKEYESLFILLGKSILPHIKNELTLEFISHRFTPRAKKNISEIFPNSTLPLDENERKIKYGQFGYYKYVYPQKEMDTITELFKKYKDKYLSNAKIEYFV